MASAGEDLSSFLRRLLALVGVFLGSLILSLEALILDIGGFRGLLFLAADFNTFNGLFNVDLCVF